MRADSECSFLLRTGAKVKIVELEPGVWTGLAGPRSAVSAVRAGCLWSSASACLDLAGVARSCAPSPGLRAGGVRPAPRAIC
jgi:hypothetical protein